MLDFAEIIAAILIMTMGSGYLHLRLLISSYIVGSASLSLYATHVGLIDFLDPELFYMNLVLSTGLCLLSTLRPNKYTRASGLAFILTSILCLAVYVEYYTGTAIFYGIYSEAMMILTAWQLALLLRIGNVRRNLRLGLDSSTSHWIRGGGDNFNRAYTFKLGRFAGQRS